MAKEPRIVNEDDAPPVSAAPETVKPGSVAPLSIAMPNVSVVELLAKAADAADGLRAAVAQAVVGQNEVIDSLLITLLARGHALLVGVPGLAKTLLVSSLARALNLTFGRVQFTPDLLPADITGTDVLAEEGGHRKLRFSEGPIFHNLVLADEINRTPPKTQAALLEAMQERRVTVGNTTHALPDPFQVFAKRTTSGKKPAIEPVLTLDEVRALAELVPRIPITDEAVALAVRLSRLSRPTDERAPKDIKEYVRFGAGPRGSQSLVLAAKARAALRGEAAADLDDVRGMIIPALRHRLVLSYRAEADGVSDVDLLRILVKAADR